MPASAPAPGARPGVLDPRAPDAVLHAWLALQRVAALRPAPARARLAAHGDPARTLAELGAGPARSVLGPRALSRSLRALVGARVGLVPFGSPAYPARLAALVDAPPLLAVRGDPQHLAASFVAIVGARVATQLGLVVADRLARGLAEHGLGVVSGLARGVDAAAHRGALAAQGTTVAMLGCGPDLVYPREHGALADAIAARGCIVSELPVGAPPARHHFPLRNRLISALSLGVVVVEARPRSGSLVTARHALEQGREVLAVPGALDVATSAGPNQLLRAGAWPVLDVGDVLDAIGLGPATPRERVHAAAGEREPEGDPILAALRAEPATRDELAARLGLSARELAERILPLEVEGRVHEERDGRLRVALGG